MPRFCVLGRNCIGTDNKQMTQAGHLVGVCANRKAFFCSKRCKQLWEREELRAKRKEERKREQKDVAKKIARLKKKGHTHCPGCKEPLQQ